MLQIKECKDRDEARRYLEAGVVDFALVRVQPVTYVYWILDPKKVSGAPDWLMELPEYRFRGNEESVDTSMVAASCRASAEDVRQAMKKPAFA